MIKQISQSFRVLFKYPIYTAISIIGMGTAIAICLLIGNYVLSSYNYDVFHKQAKNIYRLSIEVTTADGSEHFANTGKPLGDLLEDQFGAVKSHAQIGPYYNAKVKVQNNQFDEDGFYTVNEDILDVFTFEFLRGNRDLCFSQPGTMLLTRSSAIKYFNTLEVIGKTLQVEDEDYMVSGVIEDWPSNSHLNINALMHEGSYTRVFELQDWFNMDYYTYVLLDERSSQADLASYLDQLCEQEITPHLEGSGVKVSFGAQPLTGLYFEKGLIGDLPKGNRLYVNLLGISALLILILSGFNYINLTLTQSVGRAKEISVKKTLGIQPKQLAIQFGIESLIMTSIFMDLATILTFLFASPYKHYTGLEINDLHSNWVIFAGLVMVSFILGLLGNSYSGGYLTFSRALNKANEKLAVNQFKYVLVGFQFAIAAIMITVILTMNKQISFMRQASLGFTKEGIAIIDLPNDETLKNRFIAFREKVMDNVNIKKASLIGGGALPGEENGKEMFQVIEGGKTVEKVYNFYRIDANYFDLLDIRVASGRDFDKNRPADTVSSVIINEALAKSLNWDNPLDQTILYGNGGKPREVIGVVKNFHNKSLHHVIEPIVFIYDENYSSNLLVKTNPSNISFLESAWKDFFSGTGFSLTFFDGFLNAQYLKEDKLARLLGLFSTLAVIIAAMGLFALFSLNITQKLKEISIRKVLGANLLNLAGIITRKYFGIILIATGLTIPVSWYSIKYWLRSFAYRVEIDAFVFIASTAIILIVCAITTLYHIKKIAGVDPASTLKDE